jgi:predicted nucleic acid-binding protein
MIHILTDTDIILDVITGRLPYSVDSSALFTWIDKGEIKASASSLSFSNLYYVLRKHATHTRVVSRLKELSEILCILNVDESIIKRALQSDFKDFEDAIQYQSARSHPDIRVIITRNIKDYKASELPVMSPETFLKTYRHTGT